ncbi:MAG: alkaline phosphatase family protein [Oscillospiraceae bacterium]|nr:alkaline phosphatase family protein [Oscillospiraceae bacterium]
MSLVHLILIDGMRPDSLAACGNPYVQDLLENSLYSLEAKTVMPSQTLPCHMSLFHSVDPSRHGITTNVYTPQVRPINGICEQLCATMKCGMIYNWGQLRDLTQPASLVYSQYYSIKQPDLAPADCDNLVAEASVKALKEMNLNFLFTYMGGTDAVGHSSGWMGTAYLSTVNNAFNNIKKLIECCPNDCLSIVIADHGGHERTHGTYLEEDMTIPVILHGMGLRGILKSGVTIKDIAPTIVKVLGAQCDPEWEGTSLV